MPRDRGAAYRCAVSALVGVVALATLGFAMPSLAGTATGVLPGPGQGECSVVGSVAPDDTTVSVSFGSAAVTLGGAAVLDLPAATPPEGGAAGGSFSHQSQRSHDHRR